MEELYSIRGSSTTLCLSYTPLKRLLLQESFLALPSSSSPEPTCGTAEPSLPSSPLSPSSSERDGPYSVASSEGDSTVSANIRDAGSCSVAKDDFALRPDPSSQVDYLSYAWQEDDLYSSWRHVIVNRMEYGQASRLENASWRAWAKSRFGLPTVLPETLNWYKESDTTWLYGPRQETASFFANDAPKTPGHSTANSPKRNNRSILKKKGLLETLTQRSTFSLSTLTHNAGTTRKQPSTTPRQRQQRPGCTRWASDMPVDPRSSKFSKKKPISDPSLKSISCSAGPEEKHIRFSEVVEQRISLGSEDQTNHPGHSQPPPEIEQYPSDDSDDSDDDDLIMISTPRRRRGFEPPCSPPRRISNDARSEKVEMIARLPDTMLKFRTDSPFHSNRSMHRSSGSAGLSGSLPPSF